ncbi:hypothetical protein [Aeromicrobium alkaliterrae]
MSEELRRPPAVTVACIGAAFAAFLILTNVVTVLSDWGSLELQEVITTSLEEAGVGANLSLDTVLVWLRIAFYGVTVLSIATMVFAIYAVRGDRHSRVALTVLSAFAGFTLTLVGGLWGIFPAIVLIAVAIVLWTPEARVWFDLKNDRTPSPELVARARARQGLGPQRGRSADVDALTGRGPVPPQQSWPPQQGQPPRVSGVAPPPPQGHPYPYPPHQGQPQPYGTPPGWGPPLSVLPNRDAMPGTLLGAAITMIVASLLVAAYLGSVALLYVVRAVSPDLYAEAAGERSGTPLPPEAVYGLSSSDLTVTLTVVVLSLLALLALAGAGVGAALLFRRKRLLVPAIGLAALSAIASAAVAISAPEALAITSASLVSYVLLRHPTVREWAAR